MSVCSTDAILVVYVIVRVIVMVTVMMIVMVTVMMIVMVIMNVIVMVMIDPKVSNFLAMSSVYAANSCGPITEPCRRLQVRLTYFDVPITTLNNWVQSDKHDLNQLSATSVTRDRT